MGGSPLLACRACLGTSLVGSVRLSGDGWLNLYQRCVNTQIPERQMSDAVLCEKCSVLVKQFAEFKRISERSETFWLMLAKNKLKCGIVPAPLGYENQIKIETDIKDESNDSVMDFDNNFNTDHCPSEVKIEKPETWEGQAASKEISNQKDERVKPVKQSSGRGRKTVKHGGGPYICDKCGKSCGVKTNLIVHIARMHEKCVSCGLCQYKSFDATAMSQHLQEHYTNNDLKCSLCDYEGRDFADMIGHRVEHQPAETRVRLDCFLCARSRPHSAMAAMFHFRHAHLRQPGGYCRRCHKRYASFKKWKAHEHFHDNGFQCQVPLCRKWFERRSELTKHMEHHPTQPTFICEACGRVFNKKYNLNLHVQSRHAARRPTACTHCARVFSRPQYLARHLREVARDARYPCAGCSRVFPCRQQLRSHELSHRSEQPHQCHFCQRRYKRKQALNTHLMTHYGQRPAQCPECPKAFVTATQLRRHRGSHTGDRRHRCPLCPRSFHEAALLGKHRLKAHPDTP